MLAAAGQVRVWPLRCIGNVYTQRFLPLCYTPKHIQDEVLTEEEWEAKYKELEQRRDFLLSEIVDERRRCARLKAQIELLTVQREHSSVRSGSSAQVTRL